MKSLKVYRQKQLGDQNQKVLHHYKKNKLFFKLKLNKNRLFFLYEKKKDDFYSIVLF